MAIGTILGTIASIVFPMLVSAIPAGAQEHIKARGSKYYKKLEEQAKIIAKQISKNSALANKVIEAYNDKNNILLNSLIGDSLIGPRARSITKEIDMNNNEKNRRVEKIEKENTKLNSQLQETNDAKYGMQSGTIADLNMGKDKIKANENFIKQTIDGGIINEK